MVKKKAEIAPATYNSYCRMIEGRIKRFFDPLGVTISSLTPQLVDDFIETVADSGANGSTQIRYFQVMNTCLRHAVKKDHI